VFDIMNELSYEKIDFCLMVNALCKTMTTVSLRYYRLNFAKRHCLKIEEYVRGSGFRSIDEQPFQGLANLKTLTA
jgi:hypothetical protein